MAFLTALLLVLAVHLATNLAAWTGVGLLADDRFAVGLPILLEQTGASWPDRAAMLFDREVPPGQPIALYRPFVDLLFLLEQPWFGTGALGYHATNSALHSGTAMLWFVLVRRLSGSAAAATATAVLFAGWPGHSEAVHWISARTNLQSTFLMSLALVCHDLASSRAGWRHAAMAAAAAAFAVMALGSKETAILVAPLAFAIGWLRAPAGLAAGPRLRHSLLRTLPLLLALLLWLWIRARVLHTWGAGANPPWRLDASSPLAWLRALAGWLWLLAAPVHDTFTGAGWRPVLWLLQAPLLWVALRARRDPGARRTLWFAAAALAATLAAVAGLRVDASSLENVRYAYEAALPLCTVAGLGIAALPAAARGPALGLAVVIHALVLDGNRQSWLGAGAVLAEMERTAHAAAAAAPAPVRVVDAPGVWHGAFVWLVENPTLFAPPFAPAAAAGKGRVSSELEWRSVLAELAGLAAAGGAPPPLFRVAWADGGLLPLPLDRSFPHAPWPGTEIGYARIGRARPHLGTALPVQVLAGSDADLEFCAHGRCGDRTWSGPSVRRGAAAARTAPAALELFLPLPDDLPPAAAVAVELVVQGPAGVHRHALGEVRPREPRPR